MKTRKTKILSTLLSFALLITGCGTAMRTPTSIADHVPAVRTTSAAGDLGEALPEGLFDSYYAGQADPAVSKWSVRETTPYLYDLRANRDKIGESLQKTDIDLSTAKAFRVVLYDQEKGSAGQAIRFTDGKGDDYIGYFGDDVFKIEKWNGR